MQDVLVVPSFVYKQLLQSENPGIQVHVHELYANTQKIQIMNQYCGRKPMGTALTIR